MDLATRKTTSFKRRRYTSLKEAWQDLGEIAAQRKLIRRAARSGRISAAFRERLMMAVTAVNQCRYCSYFHSELALRSGVPADQLNELLAGDIPGGCPPEERVALLYAQHWAESGACPAPEARRRLIEIYGAEMAAEIEMLLRMIRAGNLTGNTFDYLLFRLSFGRLGG